MTWRALLRPVYRPAPHHDFFGRRKATPSWFDRNAEQAAERLRDGFADYFQRYDALLCPVLPIPAHAHGLSEIVINGQSVSAVQIQGATVPFNVTGLPALSIRFGTSRDGLPIGVQLVSGWLAESTVLHLASLLEAASPVRDLHPNI
jgi:aspartyl-tRNA(Asn)/glutamyl-tRNA(Gln) amidotransferase subunit A